MGALPEAFEWERHAVECAGTLGESARHCVRVEAANER